MVDPAIIEQIKCIVTPENVRIDEPMSLHTTFRIGGPADVFVEIINEHEISRLIDLLKSKDVPYFIIGNGSNLLVSDKGYRGVIIEIGSGYSGLRMMDDIIVAKAGTTMSKLSHFAMENELTGLEFAGGIPGTVGGGMIMNAGAYGGEMRQVAYRVKVIMPDGQVKYLTNAEMGFEYRNSRAKREGYIVLQAEFMLHHGDRQVIEGIMRDLTAKRKEKQPLEYPSAGSTFKRPQGYYAGKLISDSGLKGFTIGGAQVSEKHAGFLINTKDATAKDMYDLIAKVKKEVHTRFGVTLEPEVIFLGDFD
ncbi:MAG: UDP-N-acetylmuramate dehydrogenase [Lachnospiraceae bacterium]|nr:UDP-N-acetylmuramate dehydrogenase [Lachnospiraceae bacterium]